MLTHFLDFGSTGVASGVTLTGTERYRTTGSHDFGPGTVVSIWYRRQDVATNNQTIVGGQDEITTDQGPVSIRTWALRAQTDGIAWISVYAADGVPRTVLAYTWNLPVDQLWHHVLIRLESWSGAFPGTFVIRMYYDGVDRGTYSTGGPNTYFHDTAVYQSRAELGYIYQAASTGYPMQPFVGDLAQVWIGTNNSFDIRDYFNAGPVNLGATGTEGGIKTLSLPGVYDRVDFPFESDAVMQNITTRATRTPVIADAADGIQYQDVTLANSVIVSTKSASNDQVNPGRYEFGWGEITTNVYNTISLETPTVYRAIKIIEPGMYRVNITGTIAKNQATPGYIRVELRSGYLPFQSQAGAVNSGTQVMITPNLVTGVVQGQGTATSTVNITATVYLEGYLGLVFQVHSNYIEWRSSSLTVEILTA
jgi:hypothetical protein